MREWLEHQSGVILGSTTDPWKVLDEAEQFRRRRTRRREMMADLLRAIEEKRQQQSDETEEGSNNLAKSTAAKKAKKIAKDKEERHPRLPVGVWNAMNNFEVSIVPFTKSTTDVQNAVKRWKYDLWFAADFIPKLDWDRMSRVYLPFWQYACQNSCEYRGSVKVGWGPFAKYGKPHEGICPGPFYVHSFAARPHHSLLMNKVISEIKVWGSGAPPAIPLKRSINLQSLVLDRPEVSADMMYDVTLTPTAAWESSGSKLLDSVEAFACKQKIVEDERRNGTLKLPETPEEMLSQGIKVRLDIAKRTELHYENGSGPASLVLLPTYHLPYKWKQQDYYLCINGFTGEVHGTSPYSKSKIASAVALGGAGALYYWLTLGVF